MLRVCRTGSFSERQAQASVSLSDRAHSLELGHVGGSVVVDTGLVGAVSAL